MSLIDTWAATGAGAFTLSENGLYTVDAWQVFLRSLSPTGIFSVSRWFDPEAPSETTRLLALGVASLQEFGVREPRQHLILATRERVATLMASPAPFTEEDRARVEAVAAEHEFTVRLSPWHSVADARLVRIVSARTTDELEQATRDQFFDFSPPTDRRPFFFNMLKPAAFFANGAPSSVGVVSGNLLATRTLIALAGVAGVLVLAIILWPLAMVGRPALPAGVFGSAVSYFALIGLAFMLVQIPFLQTFSVYLGHPTYTFSIILFLMILSAGFGSLASERVDVRSPRLGLLPVAIAVAILTATVALDPLMSATVGWGLPGRTLVVAALVVPLAFALGFCFPIGLRLIGRHSDSVTAWMWGVNGACGVMASIVAVMISMWLGIQTNLLAAATLYALLLVPDAAAGRHSSLLMGPRP